MELFSRHRGRSKPIVQQIAEQVGGEWKAVRGPGAFCWHYESTDGRTVRTYAESVLGYDGYSDTEFRTIYVLDDGRQLMIF